MVDAFCVHDLVKGLSLNLQAQSLAKIGSTIDAEIVSKEVTSLNQFHSSFHIFLACFPVVLSVKCKNPWTFLFDTMLSCVPSGICLIRVT